MRADGAGGNGGWLDAGAVTGLAPGKMQCVVAGGRRVLLANVGGEFLATDDLCTHEDASLSTGSLHGDCVKCPLHGSRFNLRTGAALDDPAEIDLAIWAVRVEGGRIWIKPG